MDIAGERPQHDFFRTPEWAVALVLRRLASEISPRMILEPAAGVAFFFKQAPGPRPGMPSGDADLDACRSFHNVVIGVRTGQKVRAH